MSTPMIADEMPRELEVSERQKPAAEVQVGICCRQCGCADCSVYYVRQTWGGRTMRRRQCRHCGKKFTTYEAEK